MCPNFMSRPVVASACSTGELALTDLTSEEKNTDVLVCPNADNEVRCRPGERLHNLFEQRCDRFDNDGDPKHYAVENMQGAWTYAELDVRANKIARYLKEQGLGAGDIVALLFDKTVNSYASMLAVLKIHAAYVPLDPAFPPDRIAFIARDAGVSAVLTISVYRALVQNAGAAVLCLDEAAGRIDSLAGTRLREDEAGRPISDLCYIIYTSGSTGRPKGVPIEHASICNFVRVAAEVYGYRSTDRVYQGLTIAFDFAVEEIWVPLVVGATLLPNQTGNSLLGADLAIFLQTRRVTAMCCVPTLLATIDQALPDLRLLIVSGEACPRDLLTRWHSPERTILNAYGPTETTVTATLARPKPGAPVNIGRPLPTYSIVILKPDAEQALPFGKTGEIGIAGIGVAKGYLNREDQTRKAFIPDFIGIPDNPSGRIYRTGDLGRINEHGEVEYLGRIDTQVKIRGYRIELTEIESVFLRIPQIAQVVVNTFESTPGVKELVAYYTLKPDVGPLPPQDLARRLRAVLPGYMVPSYYEHLQAMPMLASDKADRKCLPAPSGARMNAAEREFAEPRGTLETKIAGVLGRVLKLDQVSAEDHFFEDLGADSLLMTLFSSQLHRELDIADCSMREIYLHPTVRKLAAFLTENGGKRTAVIKKRRIHIATNVRYGLSGTIQVVLGFAWVYLQAFVWWEGYDWTIEAADMDSAYFRSVAFTGGTFLLTSLLPIALKWILIGRWKAEEFPVWSLRYLRFWTVKQLVRFNPMALFVGTPLYIAYLKMLGARVSWKAAVFSPHVPVSTDLLSIGDGAVVSKNVAFPGYRAESGRIRTGSITVGRDAFIGPGSVLDIDTVMGDGSELAHASSLQRGQRLGAHLSYHGSPAQPADNRFRTLRSGAPSVPRMIAYTTGQLVPALLIFGPLPLMIAYYFLGAGQGPGSIPIGDVIGEDPRPLLLWISLLFTVGVPVGLVLIVIVPRLLARFIKADKVYPLYGIHFLIHNMVERMSNSKFYNELFGDSSFIVHYLSAVGYKFRSIVQTGSNFGVEQRHDTPFLCNIGKGTIVSDGLTMINTEYSANRFKLSKVSIAGSNFLGNSIVFPAEGKVGDNCLLGTKVMIPIHGPVRENTGLLGSPSFEIPRSVRRDTRFDFYKKEEVLRDRLKRKNVSNIFTMLLFLAADWGALDIAVLIWFYSHHEFIDQGPLYLTVLATAIVAVLTPYYIFVDRASLGFRRLQPRYCSIYDDYYWKHERYWKLGMSADRLLLSILNGTPFKTLAWRALGVRVGKKLFDDGCSIPEKTLVTVGDYCTLNEHSMLQSHSLEDGTFKSDYIRIGSGCTIGASAFVHYGVEMGDEVVLEPDSFLMKGELPESCSTWQGNPAREMAG